MNNRTRRRSPRLVRILLSLFGGADAEFVRGDLEESWWQRVAAGGFTGRMAWLKDVILTAFSWWTPSAVRRRARLSGHPVTSTPGGPMSDIGRDLNQAIRTLWRQPRFAILVITTLGLGIGATTTIYSVVDAVVLRGLPYANADRLVAVGNLFPGREVVPGTSLQYIVGVSGPNVRDWRERTQTLAGLEAVEFRMNLLPDQGEGPRLVPFGDVTEGFLPMLGARLRLGRGFRPGDATETGIIPVILSHREWLAATGGDPAILGREAPGVPGTSVIGVLAEGFVPPEALFGRTEIGHWRPMDLHSQRHAIRGQRRLQVIGRLAPDVMLSEARAELATIQQAVAREFPEGNVYPDGSALGAGMNDLQAQTVGTSGRTLIIFLASSVLLLLIATINATNLLLVRGLDREREMAVRLALGGSRWRIARGVLVESLLLAAAGGAFGALLATGGVSAFVRFVSPSMPRLDEVAMNARIFFVTAFVSLGLGVVAGVVPALRQSVHDLTSQSRTTGATQPRAAIRLRMSLVSAQVALAVVLSVGASLLFRSFIHVSNADPGFDVEGLTTFVAVTKRPSPEPEQSWQVWDDLLTRVAAVPGVATAAASNVPFQSPNWAPSVQLPDDPPTTRRAAGAGYVISTGYFDLMGIPLLEGRAFRTADGPRGARVAIANHAFVREFFHDGKAIGSHFRLWNDDGSFADIEIVGIVGNTVQARVEDGLESALYFPYTQVPFPGMNVVVRSERDPAALADDLRAAARIFNPIAPAPTVERLADRIRDTRTEPRFLALLFVSFAGIAVLLAAIGLYGTLAHAIGRRTREFGIRLAVGAQPGRIFTMVLRQGSAVFGIGLIMGLAGAAVATRFLRTFLFEVSTLDFAMYVCTALVLTGIAFLAIMRPARRATAVEPARVLREN